MSDHFDAKLKVGRFQTQQKKLVIFCNNFRRQKRTFHSSNAQEIDFDFRDQFDSISPCRKNIHEMLSDRSPMNSLLAHLLTSRLDKFIGYTS